MKRLTAGISACCAIVGSAMILLSGMNQEDGLEQWKPLNAELASALEEEHKPPAAGSTENSSSGGGTIAKEIPKTAQAKNVHDEPASQAPISPQAETVSVKPEPQSAASDASENKPANPSTTETSTVRRINVNTAQAAELMNIPGIGAKKAQAIIEYRNQHGSFQKVSDLDKVKGIGPKMLEKMKPYVEL